MMERVEVARLSVAYQSPTDIEHLRRVVLAVKLCGRQCEVTYTATEIVFYATWRRTKKK